VETLQAVDIQIEGDLDNSVLNIIIVDIPFNPTINPTNPANQDAQNDPQARELVNQESQGSCDLRTPNSGSNREHIQLMHG
jgi:hypothetical protein